MVIWVVKIVLFSFSVYSCHLFLISSASVMSIFLSFIVPIFAWCYPKIPLVSLIFLKRSLVFPILLFSSISFHWLLRKAFLSFLAILWNSAFKWVYLSFSHLPLASLLFSAICKVSSDNHFAFLHFFFPGEDPLEKGKATHCSILAWRIPWTVWSMGSQRVGHDWSVFSSFCLHFLLAFLTLL